MIVIIMIKKQAKLRKRLKLREIVLNSTYERTEVTIHKRTFPPEFVKDWRDVKIVEQIGKGNFGKVFKGFLSLDSVARYRNIFFVKRCIFPIYLNRYSIYSSVVFQTRSR